LLAPRPNPQAGEPPLVDCQPYLEAVSSIHKWRKCHAVVTRDSPNMVCCNYIRSIHFCVI
jgi:hypothetical protein